MKVAKLYPYAKLPTRKNPTDAGLDLYAYLPSGILRCGYLVMHIVNTGITVEIPKGYFGWITNKSKSNYLIGGGIIDEGYQGELLVKIVNPTHELILLQNGQALAQLLILPCKILDIEEVPLSEIHKQVSDRGNSGGIVFQTTNVFPIVGDSTIFPIGNDVIDWTPEGKL